MLRLDRALHQANFRERDRVCGAGFNSAKIQTPIGQSVFQISALRMDQISGRLKALALCASLSRDRSVTRKD